MFSISVFYAANVPAGAYYQSYYCIPGQTACYDAITEQLTPAAAGEKILAIIVQMTNFDDTSISTEILANKPALISYVTNATNFGVPVYQTVMDAFSTAGYPYKLYWGLNFSYNPPNYSSFHRKITTILKKNQSGQYKLVQISGSYNFTLDSKNNNAEDLYVYTIDWADALSDDYVTEQDFLVHSISSSYYTLSESRIVLNKTAQTNVAFSGYN